MPNEERFMNIEIKLSRQEDLVDELNTMVYQQQKKIDQLEGLCEALVRRLQQSSTEVSESGLAHERPPHY